jgi:hypothetical protein
MPESKSRNSNAFSGSVKGAPLHAPGTSPDGLLPAWTSLNTALPQ